MKGGSNPENFEEYKSFDERFMDHVRQVCTFAKIIPGFKCLHHDDQVTLLKSCVFEVLLVRLSGLFDNQVSQINSYKGQIQSVICLFPTAYRRTSPTLRPGKSCF